MSFSGILLDRLPMWAAALGLLAHACAGFALGALHFRGLWWSARLFASGGRLSVCAALAVGRFAVLAAALTLASLEGALPLLLTGLGVLLARPAITRRVERWETRARALEAAP